MTSYSESELVLPTLSLLFHTEEGLNTTQLIAELENLLHPSGDDMVILIGRNDNKFTQKVRNLTSHKTLTSRGLATKETEHNKPFRITDEGKKLYQRHARELDTLVRFPLTDSKKELQKLARGQDMEVLDEQIVHEGELRTRTVEYRTRSRELRSAAIEKYAINGRIACAACDFEYGLAYPNIGEGYIQIHHLKPVSFMRGETINLSDALNNVCPLCANCHQMVHTSTPPLAITKLKSILRVSYSYG